MDALAGSFYTRMLFSCLVDADYLDTERFCTPDIYRLRPAVPALSPLAVRLEDYLHRKGFLHESRVTPEELEAGAAAPCGSRPRSINSLRQRPCGFADT